MTAVPFAPPPTPLLPFGAGLNALLTNTLDVLVTQLGSTVGGKPSRAVVGFGAAVPADGCCDVDADGNVGQAHVRLSRQYPTTRFPAPDATYSRTPKELAVEIELGVFRCVHGLDDSGAPPTVEQIAQDAAVALDDHAALRATALGAFGSSPLVLGGYVPLGPSGYCAGGTMTCIVLYVPAC